jgi:transcriptional regulator GlxA family with amidase domain
VNHNQPGGWWSFPKKFLGWICWRSGIAASPERPHDQAVPVRTVVTVIFPGFQALDAVGPTEVFDGTRRHTGGPDYRLITTAVEPGWVASSSGLGFQVERPLRELRGPIDTLLVVGGDGTAAAVADRELLAQIQRLAGVSRRVTSVCSGAFILAEAGLLDGLRATTHWSVCELLARTYPSVHVDPEPIFVRDGNVATSAGVTAGMDLALALVEEDLGRDVALGVARRLVLFLRRPANQSQFSAQLSAQVADHDALRDVQAWIAEHPEGDLSVAGLARRAVMSERNFARCFRAQVGLTPARYVEQVRIEAARRRLEETDDSVDTVARECGFGTAETLRRTFLRTLRTTPTEYRRRFCAA